MIITNAYIHTMVSDDIKRGFIKIDSGKITSVGDMDNLNVHDDKFIDLGGKHIYPGFIDAHTHVGMFENGLTFEGDDGNEASDPSTPHLRAIDAVNPMDKCFNEALLAGVTCVITGPGSSNPIGGQFIAMKTYGARIDDMVLKDPVCIKFALGENPKTVYNDKNTTPCTRMATAAIIREQLMKTKKYIIDKSDDDSSCDYDAKCEALVPLLKREIPAHFHAHRADDIFTAIRIANEFNIKYVIIHATEGHLIASYLKNEDCPVLSGPFLCDRSKPELSNLTPKSPGIMSKAGVKTAIITDHPVIPIQYLPLCAGLAIKEGMDKNEALKAITITAAKICGIDDRVGSIEPNKDADLVVFNDDPLTLMANPDMILCMGNVVFKAQ